MISDWRLEIGISAQWNSVPNSAASLQFPVSSLDSPSTEEAWAPRIQKRLLLDKLVDKMQMAPKPQFLVGIAKKAVSE